LSGLRECIPLEDAGNGMGEHERGGLEEQDRQRVPLLVSFAERDAIERRSGLLAIEVFDSGANRGDPLAGQEVEHDPVELCRPVGSRVPTKSLANATPPAESLELTTGPTGTTPSTAKMAVLGLGGPVAFINDRTDHRAAGQGLGCGVRAAE
jgi:hypothetical protein